MKALVLFTLIGGNVWAADADTIRKAVVKIVSKGQGVSAELRGSGLLFSRAGVRYVLTSDHVIVHSNGLTGEHAAASSVTGETLKLKFLASEWGNGLALLEVEKDPSPAEAVSYQDLFTAPTAKVGDLASFFGYPFESADLTEETFAKLLDFGAAVPYYVQARRLVELEAAVGEFGMSGGPAFTSQGHFLGVLAYQRILEDSSPSARANRVYAVPANVVLPWLEHYFQVTSAYKPYFSEPWFAQGDPRQLLLTNDGLLLMFRVFNGRFRLGTGRTELLLFMQDGPTLAYEDTRGFLKLFRQFVKDNPWRPSEYAIVDRSAGKPVLKTIHYPAEVLASFDLPATSVFMVLGEQHEERYRRVAPFTAQLENAVATLETALKGSPETKGLTAELLSVVASLKSMPAKPMNPGTEGANEFYSADWLADLCFRIEAIEGSSVWTAAVSQAPDASKALRQLLKDLAAGLHVSEMKP
jgi:hypothetical protein